MSRHSSTSFANTLRISSAQLLRDDVDASASLLSRRRTCAPPPRLRHDELPPEPTSLTLRLIVEPTPEGERLMARAVLSNATNGPVVATTGYRDEAGQRWRTNSPHAQGDGQDWPLRLSCGGASDIAQVTIAPNAEHVIFEVRLSFDVR